MINRLVHSWREICLTCIAATLGFAAVILLIKRIMGW